MRNRLKWLEARLEEMEKIRTYSPRNTVTQVASDLGISEEEVLKLDANENFFIPQAFVHEILRESAETIDPRLYPRGQKALLTNALKEYLDLPSELIVLGNSSDELIETVVRVFLKTQEEAISITPTFAMYRIIVNAHGNKCMEIPLEEDFSLDPETLLSKTSSKTVLCFLCSPNNPTGNQFRIESIKEISERFNGIVIVDEAYVEFAPYSVKEMVEEYENIIVLRTFSKAFGLAGMRIGYTVASPGLSSALKKIQLPYNVNVLSLQMAFRVLKKWHIVKDAIERLKLERQRLFNRLANISRVKAFSSEANFALFKTEIDAESVQKGLMERGILVRNIGKVLKLGKCFRVTVGLPPMNERFLNSLEEICEA